MKPYLQTSPALLARRFVTCLLFSLICLASGWSLAQQLAFRFGERVVPGTNVQVPIGRTTSGEATPGSGPMVVIFTMVEGCVFCADIDAITEAWREAYPNLEFVLVDTRSAPEDIRAWASSHGLPIVADDDSFEEAFDTNRTPILYLLDSANIVREKIIGFDVGELMRFAQILTYANAGQWAEVESRASEHLVYGVSPTKLISGLGAVADVDLTVIYLHDSLCGACANIVTPDFQDVLNSWAEANTSTRIVLMEPEYIAHESGFSMPFDESFYMEFVDFYGWRPLPTAVRNVITEGQLPPGTDEPHHTWLPDSGWANNISVVRFPRGGDNDPRSLWGYSFQPGLIALDGEFRYVGPVPFWEGPYTGERLVLVLDSIRRSIQ